MDTLKKKLFENCLLQIDAQIADLQSVIHDAQATAMSDDKSSAGDKYETNRAMAHRESEMFGHQLDAHVVTREALCAVDINQKCDVVSAGAVVTSSAGSFFIAISADEIEIDGVEYTPISLVSPIGSAMEGKRAGEKCTFRDKTLKIISVQ